jgi:FixJ family two-component response regulator
MIEKDPLVFIIDDDASVRRSVERLFKSVGLKVEIFASAQEFLNRERPDGPSCIVLDVRMPGLSGFDLQDTLAAVNFRVPIIFLTGHGNIPLSVRAMKAGAIDFIEKPFDDQVLLEAVQKALEKDRQFRLAEAEVDEIKRRLETLTTREYQVFTHVICGQLNKQIAYDLGIVEKTIKVHRAQVMRKMQADSLADLVRMAGKAGIDVPAQ